MRALHVVAAILVPGAVALLATPANADGAKGFQYAAAFSCGTSDGTGGSAPGDYFTSISALNGGTADASANARVTLTSSDGGSDTVGLTIPAGTAVQLDCGDILDGIFTFPAPIVGFSEGFVVIKSATPLQVVARYTTSRADAVSSQVVTIAGVHVGKNWRKHRKDEDDEEICHVPPGNPSNEHTISVSKSAVPAHLGHGDHRGECDDDNDDDDDDNDDD